MPLFQNILRCYHNNTKLVFQSSVAAQNLNTRHRVVQMSALSKCRLLNGATVPSARIQQTASCTGAIEGKSKGET